MKSIQWLFIPIGTVVYFEHNHQAVAGKILTNHIQNNTDESSRIGFDVAVTAGHVEGGTKGAEIVVRLQQDQIFTTIALNKRYSYYSTVNLLTLELFTLVVLKNNLEAQTKIVGIGIVIDDTIASVRYTTKSVISGEIYRNVKLADIVAFSG